MSTTHSQKPAVVLQVETTLVNGLVIEAQSVFVEQGVQSGVTPWHTRQSVTEFWPW